MSLAAQAMLDELRTDHIETKTYAWHRDGEPCLIAMLTRNCPLGHWYGRTFDEAH